MLYSRAGAALDHALESLERVDVIAIGPADAEAQRLLDLQTVWEVDGRQPRGDWGQ